MSDYSIDSRVFSAMQTGTPFATYKKTILGKVAVTVLSPFDGKPEGVILKGDPKKNEETCVVDVWTEKENVFFRRINKNHLDSGVVIKYVRVSQAEPEEKPIEQYSDEELKEVLSLRYASFQKLLSEIESPAVVVRLLDLAKELDKTDKIVTAIESKLSDLQKN